MKGKKLIIALFMFVALAVSGALFAFKDDVKQIRYAKASTTGQFSAELEGGVIFSAEKVYFATSDSETELAYNSEKFVPIKTTGNATKYFANYALNNGNGYDYSHKSIISNKDYVMVDDKIAYSANKVVGETIDASSSVQIKQGVMVTLGGYYDSYGKVVTNAQVYDKYNKQVNLATTEVGAGMSYVAVQATLDDKPITLPNARGYNNSSNQDFTWFITPNQTTEGHYKISLLYMIGDLKQPLRYDFEFHLLLSSSYDKEIEVGNQKYNSKPKLEGADINSDFFLGTSSNYPQITFDYSRFGLSYTHIAGDVTKTVSLEYIASTKSLVLTTEIYNDKKIVDYPIDRRYNNTIVTLIFTEQGKYNFHFDYIYNKVDKIVIPQEQIPFEDIKLDIHGYQLKYSKAGYASANMTYLEIYKNNTMVILPNCYSDSSYKEDGSNLGINYTFVNSNDQRSGVIKSVETAEQFNVDVVNNDGLVNDTAYDGDGNLLGITYPRTDRGLWLTLNDAYDLGNSFYYYHPTKTIDKTFIEAEEDSVKVNKTALTKVTTFTKPGYYLLKVSYTYDDAINNKNSQYFAFQITSTTPALSLYKSDDEVVGNDESFYAREYTNKNVYATWAPTGRFESKISGKVYFIKGQYATESELKQASKTYNSLVTDNDYTKGDVLTESASYLLVLSVENSATKTYTYFTIDKEKISGLEIYEVVTNTIDNHAVYAIKQNSDLSYVTHTSKGAIDSTFAIGWADKRSGAPITATYKFTPFVKIGPVDGDPVIRINNGATRYMVNEYGLGERSNDIKIDRPDPTNLSGALTSDKVLTDQGIYEFNIQDDAGNKLTYIVLVDRTEGVVNATYGEADENGKKKKYISGQMVADFVEIEWGTHKAVRLNKTNETLTKLLTGSKIDYYYSANNNNLSAIYEMFTTATINKIVNNLFVVANDRTEIKIRPFNEYTDPYYILRTDGIKQTNKQGTIINRWDSPASELFVTDIAQTDKDIKVLVDEGHVRRYTFEVVTKNQVNGISQTSLSVYITPDKAQGEVYSSLQDGSNYNNAVMYYLEETKYFEDDAKKEQVSLDKEYGKAQASNDGVFVFEWIPQGDNDSFSVTEVKYDFYQLMNQDELNRVTASNIEQYPYYPYKYSSTELISSIDPKTNIETVNGYKKATRTIYENGESVSKTVNRSHAINLAYETYYNENNELVSRQVTQTGFYIITRTISTKDTENDTSESSQMSYAFFVDRNMIVGYSLTDIKQKLVGQFIHFAMPNSKGETEVRYDDFTKQGVRPLKDVEINGKSVSVCLETNKLPSRVQVPTGKYVSGTEDKKINYSSYLNIDLQLTVYFLDSYKLLSGGANTGALVKLMDKFTLDSNDKTPNDYIDLTFKNITNPGLLQQFKNSRYLNSDDNRLSLPGVYIFVVNDKVSKEVNEQFEIVGGNEFMFAVKLTNSAPTMEMYAYAEGNSDDKIYCENNILYTNQEFVDFVIAAENTEAYQAQLDIASLEIRRNDLSIPWMKIIKDNSSEYGFEADSTGLEQNIFNRITFNKKDGKIVSYTIKLDTGLTVDKTTNQIVDYEEYTYTIYISYILTNTELNKGEDYYTYLDEGFTTSFYRSTYTVEIDRTPNSENLNNLMLQQGDYFKDYHDWLYNPENKNLLTEQEQQSYEANKDVNKVFAYRSDISGVDNYGLANNLFYQYVKASTDVATQSMFALNVYYDSVINTNELNAIYYRKLDFNSSDVEANKFMGLLPINKNSFEATGYYTFSETSNAYERKTVFDNNVTYSSILMKENASDLDSYNFNFGGFYEVIEKDFAGNYTQYVVYFANEAEQNVEITINGKLIGNNVETSQDPIDVPLIFVNNTNVQQEAFIGIDAVSNLTGIADTESNDNNNNNPYYGKINIRDASNDIVEIIYINSKSNKDTIKNTIHNVIKEQGNYTLEYVNVFNKSKYVKINNYKGIHELNIYELKKVKTDPSNGQEYIKFSDLNTKIDDKTYWYVTDVEVSYYDNGEYKATYTASQTDGITELTPTSVTGTKVNKDPNESDRLNLADNTQYFVKLKDIGGKEYIVPISTDSNYFDYDLSLPENHVKKDNIYYTSSEVVLTFNKDFYTPDISVFVDGDIDKEVENLDRYYTYSNEVNNSYDTLILLPDLTVEPADYFGSLRKFEVVLTLNQGDALEGSQTYKFTIYIDTRATDFIVLNTNRESKIDNIKTTFNTESKITEERMIEFIDRKYYGELINETINVSWSKLQSDYFMYSYELYEFESATKCNKLLSATSSETSYPISPKNENTTGKYILKVTIYGKDGVTWIADKLYGIYMSTTVSGLYTIKDDMGKEIEDYSAITNLREVLDSIATTSVQMDKMRDKLGFKSVGEMNEVFDNFGYKTAIPMYISNTNLDLHSNEDNAVYNECYEYQTSSVKIEFYHIYRTNYVTFAVIMEVAPVDQSQSILSTLKFYTSDETSTNLLSAVSSKIYDDNAQYYKLIFSSYNTNVSSTPTPLEMHNKILIKVYYNNSVDPTSIIKGGNESATTTINFDNSGVYRLEVCDIAGNKQTFRDINESSPYFILVVMKKNDMLYTINGQAPVQYAYYDNSVELEINHTDEITGKYYYDLNSITVSVRLNSNPYNGYEHNAGSAIYRFTEYGTYVVTMSAKIIGTDITTRSQLVFTIINPNEARRAMDFTSIYGYNIVSVTRIYTYQNTERDITAKFMDLLKDKSNTGEIDVYNKLITYDRVAEALNSVSEGKMKFRVVYEAKNDDLLPERRISFEFTLNDGTAVLNSSIKPGGKTTKEVTISFNAALIYNNVGDCDLVVNGEKVLRIDEALIEQLTDKSDGMLKVTEFKLKDVGKYYIQLMGDSGNVITSFNFTIKEPLNVVSIILIVVVVSIVLALVGTFIWLRTRMKVR